MNGFLLFLCHVSDECRRLLPICDPVECLIYCIVSGVSYVASHAEDEDFGLEIQRRYDIISRYIMGDNGTNTRVSGLYFSRDLS